jgi:SAM-dependent methyltransferase
MQRTGGKFYAPSEVGITVWHRRERISMDIKEAGLIKGEISEHFYYRAKLAALRRLIEKLQPRHILDVGAGTGFFSKSLLEQTCATQAICVDPGYSADKDCPVNGKKLHYRRQIDQSDADLVLMMDVAEHVADDFTLFKEYADKVQTGTHFVITVPALQWLWSDHDVFLEHFRRYNLTELENVVRRAGLAIEHGCYYFGALLPLVVPARIGRNMLGGRATEPRSQMREFGPVANALLWNACRSELSIFRANRLCGLTAFVRAVKP